MVNELLGQNSAPNPQELLMTALNACITVGYVAGAAVKGVTLATPCGSRAAGHQSSIARSTRQ